MSDYDLFGHTLSDFASEGRDILKRAKEKTQPVKTFALFSGGNDSTTMLHLVKDEIDAAVHINTGIGIPQTSRFVRTICDSWKIPLIELATSPSVYRDIVLGPSSKGFPGPAFHYICYHRLKSQRLQELQRDYSKRGQTIVLVSGVRAHESTRRMKQIGGREIDAPRGRLGRCTWANPIVHFDSRLMAEYRSAHNVPRSPVADLIHKSGECLCGAFSRPWELEELEVWFPETAAYIRELEQEATKLGKRYQKWGHTKPTKKDLSPGPLCSSCRLF